MPDKKPGAPYFYPVTPETIHRYARAIFEPLSRGECVTTIWVPMAGRRMWNKFLIENINLFSKELAEYSNYLLVYVEPLDLTEESLAGYVCLLGNGLLEACSKSNLTPGQTDLSGPLAVFADDGASYPKMLSSLREVLHQVAKMGRRVVFFLGEFDELSFASTIFYNNLKSLWQEFSPTLSYVFLTLEDISAPSQTSRLGELNAATLQNLVYVPLPSEEDFFYLIGYFSDRFGYQLNPERSQIIKKICGVHPCLIKSAARILAQNGQREDEEKALLEHYEMLSMAKRIFDFQTGQEKTVLNELALGKQPEEGADLSRLLQLGVVVKQEEGYSLFGELFKKVALQPLSAIKATPRGEVNGLYLDEKTGAVCLNGASVEERFTRQEYDLVHFLLKNLGQLKTRDEIGHVLWGDESYEKYSDWAIDQIISKIRRKLGEMGTTAKMVTLKGKGYKLVSS